MKPKDFSHQRFHCENCGIKRMECKFLRWGGGGISVLTLGCLRNYIHWLRHVWWQSALCLVNSSSVSTRKRRGKLNPEPAESRTYQCLLPFYTFHSFLISNRCHYRDHVHYLVQTRPQQWCSYLNPLLKILWQVSKTKRQSTKHGWWLRFTTILQ